MSKHITVMLCSRADGAYCYPGNSGDEYEEYGAIPPYLVHSSKGGNKTDKDERTENDNNSVEEATSAFSNGLYTYDVNNDMKLQKCIWIWL
eukprot:11677376-Ditylum_brightwellii.AAC.1